jgi:hypothetical protein
MPPSSRPARERAGPGRPDQGQPADAGHADQPQRQVIVCAHLGRPGGRPDLEYSLAPVAARLGGLVGQEVDFPGDIVGRQARAAIAALRPGGVVMLENLRFDAAETSKDDMARGYFADRFAAPADLYVAVGFRRYAPQARQCLRCAAVPDQRGWLPGPGRGGRAAAADSGHPAAVCGGARRREGRG